jgi:hypothetical protein
MKYPVVILILLGHLFLMFGCNEEAVKVPTITSFTPLTGRLDTLITINGVNFDGHASSNNVKINGFPCPIVSFSPNVIVIRAVPGVTTGKISVTVGNLAALSFDDFILKSHTITDVTPNEGKVGDEIIITGSNYPNSLDSVKVLFYDSIPADLIEYKLVEGSDTIRTLKAIVPQSATTGKIRIRVVSEIAESENDFTVLPD